MAGYIATVAAGGTPTLSLTESSSRSYPEVTAWAYVVGGIGERVVWTSSFDGLGRLVARELMRPLRLDEPPNCDFSLDEAVALYDPQLSDPLVHLKIKQARIVTVSLYPGVNLQVPIGDYVPFEKRKQDTGTDRRPTSSGRIVGSDDEVFAVLADRLWPHLRGRLGLDIGSSEIGQNSTSTTKKKNTSKKGRASQDDLPLVGSDSRKR
jgi:hypothetical protein